MAFLETSIVGGAASNLHSYWLFGWLLGIFWINGCEFAYQLYSLFYILFSPTPTLWHSELIKGIKRCDAKFASDYF